MKKILLATVAIACFAIFPACNAEFVCNEQQSLCDIADEIEDGIGDEFNSVAEDLIEEASNDRSFTCDDDTVILSQRVCDGLEDCEGGEDEFDCE